MTDRPRLLFLLTDEISSVLVRGQLGFLSDSGFDVAVAARLADPARPADGAWDDGVAVHHLPMVREPSPLADLKALWATLRLVRSVRPDVVNASTPKAGLLGMLAARLARVPVRVYVVRGYRFETAVGWRRTLLRWLERLASRCANRVVFNSDSLQAVGERDGVIRSGRGEVIGPGSGNGVDTARFADDVVPARADARRRLGVPDEHDTVVVGFVGRFTSDKGIADLVHAVSAMRAERPGLHLLLVGQFEDGDPVPADVRAEIDGGGHVTVVPWLDHTGIAYRAMDVLAFPSYREGLPNVPLEAQLCGVPVVAYAATGTVDAVRGGGVLVPTGDVAAFADALAAVVADPEQRVELGDVGRAWVGRTFDRRLVWQAWRDRYRAWTGSAADRDDQAEP